MKIEQFPPTYSTLCTDQLTNIDQDKNYFKGIVSGDDQVAGNQEGREEDQESSLQHSSRDRKEGHEEDLESSLRRSSRVRKTPDRYQAGGLSWLGEGDNRI